MGDFDRLADHQLAGAGRSVVRLRAAFALVYSADVSRKRPGKIRARRHIAIVVVEFVRAGHHVLAAFERFVDDHRKAVFQQLGARLEAHWPQKSGGAVQKLLQFLGHHRTQLRRAGRAHQLGFIDLMVAAQKHCQPMPSVGLIL